MKKLETQKSNDIELLFVVCWFDTDLFLKKIVNINKVGNQNSHVLFIAGRGNCYSLFRKQFGRIYHKTNKRKVVVSDPIFPLPWNYWDYQGIIGKDREYHRMRIYVYFTILISQSWRLGISRSRCRHLRAFLLSYFMASRLKISHLTVVGLECVGFERLHSNHSALLQGKPETHGVVCRHNTKTQQNQCCGPGLVAPQSGDQSQQCHAWCSLTAGL